MYYDCLDTLPDNVKAALDSEGQMRWMDAFNKSVKKATTPKSYRQACFDAWQVLKHYEGCRYFSGLVSTEDLDRQNDVVEVNKAFERIQKHVERGGTMVDTHTNRTVGSFIYVEKIIGRTGKPAIKAHSVIYQGEPYYNSVWEQIKKGQDCPTCRDVRKGFSIGGFALDTRNSCDASGCHREILDMSIHEISICQEPANPEALIQDVNMMAKAEDNLAKDKNEISKVLREDEAAPAEAPAESQVAGPAGPAGQAQEASPFDNVDALDEKLKKLIEDVKRANKIAEQYGKLNEVLNQQVAQSNGAGQEAAPAMPAEMVGTAKSANCGRMDEDVHTPIDAAKCPENKELYGDVNDAQVKDSMEFLENKDIEPEKAAKKDHGELMPGKPDLKGIKFEKDKVGPVQETKVMEGFSKLEPKNAAESNKDYKYSLDPKKGQQTINDKGGIEEKNFGKEGKKDLMQKGIERIPSKEDLNRSFTGTMNKPLKVRNLVPSKEEEEEAEIGKGCPCEEGIDAEHLDEDKKGFNEIEDNAEEIDDKVQEMKQDDAELEDMDDTTPEFAEIPADLLPAFKEFLQAKGIKMEPKADAPEIEGPVEKMLLLDDDISEMDLKELADPLQFDSAEVLGKAATQKLRIHDINARLRLAKSLKVADIEYLLDNEVIEELSKSVKKKFEKLEKILPVVAAAGGSAGAGAGAAAGGAARAGAAGESGAAGKGGLGGSGGGGGMGPMTPEMPSPMKTIGSAMNAAKNVLGHAQQVASSGPKTNEDAPSLAAENRQKAADKMAAKPAPAAKPVAPAAKPVAPAPAPVAQQPAAPAAQPAPVATKPEAAPESLDISKAFEEFQKGALRNVAAGIKGGAVAGFNTAKDEYDKRKKANEALNQQEEQAGKRGLMDRMADYKGDSTIGNIVSGGAQMARGVKRMARGARKAGANPDPSSAPVKNSVPLNSFDNMKDISGAKPPAPKPERFIMSPGAKYNGLSGEKIKTEFADKMNNQYGLKPSATPAPAPKVPQSGTGMDVLAVSASKITGNSKELKKKKAQ